MADVVPMTGVEVFYPIVPLHLVDKHLTQQDSMSWTRVALAANKVRDVVRFRVRSDNFDAFLSFLESHRVTDVELNTPGLYPFGKNFTRSDCRVIYYGGHTRETDRLFRIDVTFEWIVGVA